MTKRVTPPPSADPRGHLPAGSWTLKKSKVLEKDEFRCFWVYATDEAHQDRVTGYVTLGELTGYSRGEWGLPEDLALDLTWHLGRIEPRDEKARGGTKALIRYLGRLADEANVWITTEVKTGGPVRNHVVVDLLMKHGGFEYRDEDYKEMLIRKPSTPSVAVAPPRT